MILHRDEAELPEPLAEDADEALPLRGRAAGVVRERDDRNATLAHEAGTLGVRRSAGQEPVGLFASGSTAVVRTVQL